MEARARLNHHKTIGRMNLGGTGAALKIVEESRNSLA